MNKIFLLAVVMVITYVHMSHGSHNALSSTDIACIRGEFIQTNPTDACTTVERGIEALYSVDGDDFLVAIASNTNLFDTFCQRSCGQAIINALGVCGVYNLVRDEAQLLINLCSANNGRACYRDFVNVATFFSDAFDCGAEIQSSGTCSESCRTTLTSGVQSYGCCVNIPIIYTQAVSPDSGVNAGANQLFDRCSVSRPATCPASPLGLPGSGGGSGAGHLVAAVTLLVLSSIISILMSL